MTVELTTLANGFRVVTERMPGIESSSVGIWVKAGARYESEQENGIAHFLEHMAFKGTSRRSAAEIAEAIENVGGYLNAYTGRETTAYYARVLGTDLPLAVDVIADILRNPLFDENEIELERGVILQEIGQALDTPDDIVFDWLQETAYPNQPMGRPILGRPETVRSFRRDDFLRFTGAHYTPGNLILSAAGAVDHDALVKDAERLFGDLKPAPSPLPAPARFVGGELRRDKDLEQVHVALAIEGLPITADEVYAAQAYAIAMGGGMSSRLFQEIRERRGLCYTIHAQSSAWSDTGMFTIYAGTSGEDIAELLRVSHEELARSVDGLSVPEIARAKAQMKAGLLMGLESPGQRAERMARLLQIWGRVLTVDETIERIDAVDDAALRAMAERVARRAPAAMALYGPIGSAPHLGELRQECAA